MALRDQHGLTTTELADFARVADPEEEEALLQRLLHAGADAVEGFLRRDFPDAAVPEPVNLWILRLATRYYEQRQAGVQQEGLANYNVSYRNIEAEMTTDLWPWRKVAFRKEEAAE